MTLTSRSNLGFVSVFSYIGSEAPFLPLPPARWGVTGHHIVHAEYRTDLLSEDHSSLVSTNIYRIEGRDGGTVSRDPRRAEPQL